MFGAIASSWGYGDNSTTFNLPDMRGRFPRGRDAGIARDPDRATRTAANTGGNTGDNVGSVQGNATGKNGLTVAGGTASLIGTVAGGTASLTGTVAGGTASLTGAIAGGSISDPGHSHNIDTVGGGGAPYGSLHDSHTTNNNTFVTSAQSTGITHVAASNGTLAVSNTAANNGTLAVSNTAANNGTLAVSNTAASIGAGDNETRPINANVNYIIKI